MFYFIMVKITYKSTHMISIFEKRVKTRVRFTAYLNWKKDIWCYGLSFFCLEKLPALHNQIRKFSKKTYTLRYFPFENKRYEQHMSKTTYSRKTTIHMIIVCVKVQNLLFCCERAYKVKLLFSVKKGAISFD